MNDKVLVGNGVCNGEMIHHLIHGLVHFILSGGKLATDVLKESMETD